MESETVVSPETRALEERVAALESVLSRVVEQIPFTFNKAEAERLAHGLPPFGSDVIEGEVDE